MADYHLEARRLFLAEGMVKEASECLAKAVKLIGAIGYGWRIVERREQSAMNKE